MASDRSLTGPDTTPLSPQRLCSSYALTYSIIPSPRNLEAFPVPHLLVFGVGRIRTDLRGRFRGRWPAPRLDSFRWDIDSIQGSRGIRKRRRDFPWESQYLVRWADTWCSVPLLESAELMPQIEAILNEEVHFSTHFYLVRWKDSWEPSDNLDDAKDAITEYLVRTRSWR